MSRYVLLVLLVVSIASISHAQDASVTVNFAGTEDSLVNVSRGADHLRVVWPIDAAGEQGIAKLSLKDPATLIQSLSLSSAAETITVLENAAPEFQLFVGQRRQNPNGIHTFFDRVDEREYTDVPLKLDINAVTVQRSAKRATVKYDSLRGDRFHGELHLTFFAGTPLIHIEAIVSTDQAERAILYRAGLNTSPDQVDAVVYHQAGGSLQSAGHSLLVPYRPWKIRSIGKRQGLGQPEFDREKTPLIGRTDDGILQARYRAIAVKTAAGSVAVFPTPHKFLYPLDFAENLGFNFAWKRDGKVEVGVRQPPLGDGRFRPWVDCPAGSRQRLDLFVIGSTRTAEQLINQVARFTHHDRYQQLTRFKTFTSHYHMWHTRELMDAQQRAGTQNIPPAYRRPLWVDKMKKSGMDIVHLAEFHGGPRTGKSRYQQLQVLHRECARLSDDDILILPGEEPNVHLGGHWVSLFPKPVYWDFLNRSTPESLRKEINRGDGPPFQRRDPELGVVYFVNSAADVQKLFERENGLYWTAHPRIKGSTGYPDRYRDSSFFKSDHFLGGAWKAMPADYSYQRLGRRVFELLDDMNQWGAEKQIIGEADLFKLNPASELYGHANINYLKLDRVPKFADGWGEVLDALRHRQYFTTTGEVLIPSFKLNGEDFPERVSRNASAEVELEVELQGTFPLAFAEIISGDGSNVFRARIDLRGLGAFAETKLHRQVELKDRDWVRLEVWDIAANGAFTQPVLLGD